MKMILSVAGVLALTMGAWAFEAGIETVDHGAKEKSFLLRISGSDDECKLHDHETVTADKRGGGVTEKNSARNKASRAPLPAERLGLMLKLSSL